MPRKYAINPIELAMPDAISPLTELIDTQDDEMKVLFAKALNLFVSPGADAMPDKEKLDRLRKAIEDSLK